VENNDAVKHADTTGLISSVNRCRIVKTSSWLHEDCSQNIH